MLRTLENWSPVYKSCGSNTCERWTQSVEPKTSHTGHGAGGWQWRLDSPCVSAGKGCSFRADKCHFLYRQRIPRARLAGSMERAGEPRSIWSVMLGTWKESVLSAEQRLLWKSPRRLLLALGEGKSLLLFLLLKAEETEAVHTDLGINTHIFHSRINTRGIFCYCII